MKSGYPLATTTWDDAEYAAMHRVIKVAALQWGQGAGFRVKLCSVAWQQVCCDGEFRVVGQPFDGSSAFLP